MDYYFKNNIEMDFMTKLFEPDNKIMMNYSTLLCAINSSNKN